MLSVGGVSPAQIVFGRNPEVLADLLQDNPNLVANSCILHDPVANKVACIRAASRRVILAHNENKVARRALDARPRVLRSFQPGEMVAVWRSINPRGKALKMSHYRWRPGIVIGAVRGNYWIALPGSVVKAAPEQLRVATVEERTAWRLVELELRTHTVDLDILQGAYYQEISKDQTPPVSPEEDPGPEPWEVPPQPQPQAQPQPQPPPPTPASTPALDFQAHVPAGDPSHPTGSRRTSGKSEPTLVAIEPPSKVPRTDSSIQPPPGLRNPVGPPRALGPVALDPAQPRLVTDVPIDSDSDSLQVFDCATVCLAETEGADEDPAILAITTCDVLLARGRKEEREKSVLVGKRRKGNDRWKQHSRRNSRSSFTSSVPGSL